LKRYILSSAEQHKVQARLSRHFQQYVARLQLPEGSCTQYVELSIGDTPIAGCFAMEKPY
jgi:hypothetical protein